MRLICPNCGAQYEVPTEVIPEGGRDVQCSNCGHTWYQRHPDDDRDLAEELNEPLPEPEWTPEPEPRPAAPRGPVPPPPPPAAAPAEEVEEPGPASPEPELQRSRSIDPEMAELFREERDFEARRRAAEALESQPDLGLAEPDEDELARRSRQARERMARLRGEDPEAVAKPATPRPAPPATEPQRPRPDGRAAAEAAAAAAAGSRRDLLPDVDEINQTLRATSEPRVVDTARGEQVTEKAARREGGGFSKGFFMVVVLVLIALAIYVSAPQITEAVPAAAPVLQAYVEAVDAGRTWLDGQVTALLQTLDGMSSEAPPEGDPAPQTDPAPAPDATATDG
ncbi:zinc-ribbon domain-containing protein [Pseudoponticoccus marisrubri]|uniref:zinc-ribbon domain-containing protein n=1 Tax=Pseudoponticoccus marisrubri TaxID=1685382 RepID=UPI000A034C0D|nr:zinc-ribbon domain-containing protein [Pseudoponticoccus marisrubri]